LKVAAHADQWDAQATVKRINESLIERGYVTWFDLTNMKGEQCCYIPSQYSQLIGLMPTGVDVGSTYYLLTGCDAGSTVDAMSDAIEGADVMLYGVSLAYKESANASAVSNLSSL
jgi:hypothetical protein